MRPTIWSPPIELSPDEQAVVKLIRRAKLFVGAGAQGVRLSHGGFRAELPGVDEGGRVGPPPVPPAKLALATIVQAYTSSSDDEAIECMVMDRRWQLVLDCLDAT